MSEKTVEDRFVEGRRALHTKLVEILGSNNVYYQPPENVKLKYPAIVYFRSAIPVKNADNGIYKMDFLYTLTLVGTEPQPVTAIRLLNEIKNIKYDRNYIADGMYHDTYTLYI